MLKNFHNIPTISRSVTSKTILLNHGKPNDTVRVIKNKTLEGTPQLANANLVVRNNPGQQMQQRRVARANIVPIINQLSPGTSRGSESGQEEQANVVQPAPQRVARVVVAVEALPQKTDFSGYVETYQSNEEKNSAGCKGKAGSCEIGCCVTSNKSSTKTTKYRPEPGKKATGPKFG